MDALQRRAAHRRSVIACTLPDHGRNVADGSTADGRHSMAVQPVGDDQILRFAEVSDNLRRAVRLQGVGKIAADRHIHKGISLLRRPDQRQTALQVLQLAALGQGQGFQLLTHQHVGQTVCQRMKLLLLRVRLTEGQLVVQRKVGRRVARRRESVVQLDDGI